MKYLLIFRTARCVKIEPRSLFHFSFYFSPYHLSSLWQKLLQQTALLRPCYYRVTMSHILKKIQISHAWFFLIIDTSLFLHLYHAFFLSFFHTFTLSSHAFLVVPTLRCYETWLPYHIVRWRLAESQVSVPRGATASFFPALYGAKLFLLTSSVFCSDIFFSFFLLASLQGRLVQVLLSTLFLFFSIYK